MSRLYWVFVLLAVVVVPSHARRYKCEQSERFLRQAEYALNRARQLFPNCGAHVSTEETLTYVTTEEPTSDVTTEEPTSEVTKEGFRPKDCQELLAAGHVTSGVYSVWPRLLKSHVRVRCDMDTDGGGWTVIQRRGNFSSQQENFFRNWTKYKNGFGSLERDFWIGNDNIFALTNQGNYSLRMDMTAADGESAYALYREFRIEDENTNYTLHVDGYSGTAGDRMTDQSGHMFSTKDRDNDVYPGNCAESQHGGFWYDNCGGNPNGLYKPGEYTWSTMNYFSFKEIYGLSSIDMKIKRL